MSSIIKSGITLQVTDAIRQAIITGQFKPGQKVSESSLSEYYKVSRTPIREALKQLNAEGLVDIIPRVGTYISTPTLKTLTELFTIKEVLEGLAANLMAKNKDKKYIEKLETAYKDIERAFEKTNYESFIEANDRFHQTIHLGSGSSELNSLLKNLVNQVSYSRYVNLGIKNPGRFGKSLTEHKDILEAIKNSNSKEAERLMRKHVRESAKNLKDINTKK